MSRRIENERIAGDLRPTLEEARRRASSAAADLGSEQIPLDAAVRRRLTEPVTALADLPHYASSAMDGWGVAGDPPWTVRSAGPVEPGPIQSGQCVAIVTGGVVTPGVSAVLREEHAERSGDVVRPTANARPDEPRVGEHIRPAATEARRGDELIPVGALLTPAHIALAASAGHDRLTVARRPRIALLLTGDEVVGEGIPVAGRVRDTFGPVLPAIVDALGGEVVASRRVTDDRDELRAAIGGSEGVADVVLTTGGTGRSGADHLRRVLQDLDADLLVDGIRMRPGGPTVLARLVDGRLLLGLPGNPLAAITTLVAIGAPLLAALSGAVAPTATQIAVARPVEGRSGTVLVVPYRSSASGAHPVVHRGAAMLRGLAEADGLLLVPAGGAAAGESVTALPLPWARG